MKKIIVGLFAGWMLCQAGAAEAPWLTDLSQAAAKARAENKMVLIDFTGSDWCSWCIKFDQEVLRTAEFSRYAETNLVLVKLDYPHKIPQSAELKKTNEALQKKYNVSGFPTFVLLGSDGREVWRQEGYTKGGPKPFIRTLDSFRKKN